MIIECIFYGYKIYNYGFLSKLYILFSITRPHHNLSTWASDLHAIIPQQALILQDISSKLPSFTHQIYSHRITICISTVLEISLHLCAKAPTLDQPDLRVEFMVQGMSRPWLTTSNNKIFLWFYIFSLTNKTKEQAHL